MDSEDETAVSWEMGDDMACSLSCGDVLCVTSAHSVALLACY